MLRTLIALIAAAMFAGAALYVSLAEHRARLGIDDRSGLAQFKASYRKAAPLMAGLALASMLLGLWAWWRTEIDWLLCGALLIGAAVPFTLIVVMPVNRRLEATTLEAAGAASRALLRRWGGLHLVAHPARLRLGRGLFLRLRPALDSAALIS